MGLGRRSSRVKKLFRERAQSQFSADSLGSRQHHKAYRVCWLTSTCATRAKVFKEGVVIRLTIVRQKHTVVADQGFFTSP